MKLVQKSLRIVVAEDDELIGELLAEMLAIMGHEVCSIESTETGTVEAASKFQPDLLIVDLHLSPGSGLNAIDRILQTQVIPHVLMSANIARLRELRPDAIMLEKPFTQASLALAKCRAYEGR
jgi:CheY-like chemotaxis protein